MIPSLLLLFSVAHAADPLPFEIHARTLDNGLEVIAVEAASPGVVAVRTWFAVGSRDETVVGQTGYAHFFEHLMFHGTEARPRGIREAQLVAMGAEDNAWTWFDETVYTTVLPAEELAAHLETEADRFAHLALTADGVRREAGAVYGEYRKSRSDPDERVNDTLYATAFTVHTYAHSTIGLEADIANMPEGHAAAVRFLAEHYRPDRAALLVVGDAEPEAVFALAEAHFGAWVPAEVDEEELSPPIAEEPAQEGIRRAQVEWPQPTAPRLVMGWKIPGHDPRSEDLALLELLAAYLDSRTGPLYRRLVEEEGTALAVHARRDDFVDPGLFAIGVRLTPGADPAAAEAAIREVLAGVEPAALADVKRHRTYTQVLGLEHVGRLADALGWQHRRGGSPESLSTWLSTQAEADLARLPEVIADTFTDGTLTVVTLEGP